MTRHQQRQLEKQGYPYMSQAKLQRRPTSKQELPTWFYVAMAILVIAAIKLCRWEPVQAKQLDTTIYGGAK